MADDESKTVDAPAKTEDAAPAEKKGRGRPKKAGGAAPASKAKGTGKRGRPKLPESEKKTAKPAGTGKRGRPKGSGTGSKPKTHPPVAEMVMDAVQALKDRRGCSLSAVKKYIAANYKVDMERQSIFVRRYVRRQIDNGTFSLVKGTSTTGSFKLADPADKKKVVKKSKGATGKRGRPKGSTNKTKTPKKAKPAKSKKESKAKPAKGSGKPRGRPKGSSKKKASE